jgi:Putative beta-barrel porin-2, OmpL-like. bbp2
MKRINTLAIATLAAAFAFTWATASRAEDQPAATEAAQPAAASQPAATSQPTADQRLQDLEKEVGLLQQEIAALKAEEAAAPSMKTAALTQPAEPANYTPAAAPAEDAPKINLAGLLGPVTLSGFGDAYYGYDSDHPFNNLAGLRSFEAPTNSFNFNMAELILDKAAGTTTSEDRLGYHVSAGYGYGAKIVNGSDSNLFTDHSNFFLKEAYLDYIVPFGKGLTVTVGKFVTPMGAEVIESNANWNYSRGLLFDYAIPFFHFGANAKYAFNSKFAVTGYLVNGWNNTIITHVTSGSCATAFTDGFQCGQSAGLTYGASLAWTPNMKWSVTENYFAGPVVDVPVGFTTGQSITDWKQISDTVVGFTPNAKWAFQLNGDYGFGPREQVSGTCDDAVVSPATSFSSHPVPEGGTPTGCLLGPAVNWWGVAGYAKYTWTPKTNFAVRYEYFDDPQGYVGLLTDNFGDGLGRGWAQEVTGTYSYNLTSALLIRAEYRYDFASKPIFDESFSNEREEKQQNTALISFVYSFSSANMK